MSKQMKALSHVLLFDKLQLFMEKSQKSETNTVFMIVANNDKNQEHFYWKTYNRE